MRSVMAALFLPGLSRPNSPRRTLAPSILRMLRQNPCPITEAATVVEYGGCWEAAVCLSDRSLLVRAQSLVQESGVLTLACPNYPAGWLRLSTPPPALWLKGPLSNWDGAVGVVGSREPPNESAAFTEEVAKAIVELGTVVVSGGAPGCDQIAGRAAGADLVELLPCGIRQRWGVQSGCVLSVRDPSEQFTTAAAMERNALIYAFGRASVVCHARFKVGGAWIGATDALRRRLGPLFVWSDPTSLASRALIALGGRPLERGSEIGAALDCEVRGKTLFD